MLSQVCDTVQCGMEDPPYSLRQNMHIFLPLVRLGTWIIKGG
jgi:hypothetical protein